MRWLQLAELLELHRRLIEQSGGMPGLQDLGLIEPSLALPRQSLAGMDLYPGIVAKAAALGFSLIQNHPFVDGNKLLHRSASAYPTAPLQPDGSWCFRWVHTIVLCRLLNKSASRACRYLVKSRFG